MRIFVLNGGNIPSKVANSYSVMKMAQGFFDSGHNVNVITSLSAPSLIRMIKYGNVNKFYGINDNIKVKFIPTLSFKVFLKSK